MGVGNRFARPQAGVNSASSPNSQPAAALDLSFVGASALDGRITFTRASTATYFDKTGTMQTAASGAPRFDYDPVALLGRGLLMEESRANVCAQSVPPTSWGLTGATLTSSLTAPDGTSNARLLTEDTSTGNHQASPPNAMVTSTQYAISVFAKAGARRYLVATGLGLGGSGLTPAWDLIAGTDITTGSAGGFTHGIIPVGNGWFRCWFVFTITNAILSWVIANTAGLNISYTGDGASGLWLWGTQCEAGAFVTSYISTGGSTVTRAAEVATMPTSGWYNASAGTLQAEWQVNQASVTGTQEGIVRIDDTTDNNRVAMYVNVSGNIAGIGISGGVSEFNNFLNTGGAALTFPAYGKSVITYGATWHSAYNGGLGQVGGGALAPGAPTRMLIGLDNVNGTAWQLDGWLRRIRYWNSILTDAQLRQVTS